MTQVLDGPVVETAPVAIEPRILERREEVARLRRRRRVQIGAVVGGVAVVVGGAWGALHSAVLAARHVVVIGAVHTGVAPVEAAVGLTGQPLVDVNPGKVAARVEALPWVAAATVTRHWPDTVAVTVVERSPAAVVPSGHGLAVVDRSGRVLAVGSEAPPGLPELTAPVVPGRPGTTLGPPAGPGLAVLGAVPPMLAPRLERVEVAADGDVTLALTGRIGATLGPALELRAKFEALVSVLVDVAPTTPEVIDVTVPDAPAVGPPPVPHESLRGAGRPAPAVPVAAGTGAPQMRQARRRPS